jgi:hypothetical protein
LASLQRNAPTERYAARNRICEEQRVAVVRQKLDSSICSVVTFEIFAREGKRQRMEIWAGVLLPYRNNEKPSELLDYLIKTVEEEKEEEEDAGTLSEGVGPMRSRNSGVIGGRPALQTESNRTQRLGRLDESIGRYLI